MITDYIKHMNYTESIEYKDGIYICYEDGHKELFDKGKNTKEGIKDIGFVWGEYARRLSSIFSISLKDVDIKNYVLDVRYYPDIENAKLDFNGIETSKKIYELKSINDSTYNQLKDSYIPAIGELIFILKHKKELEEALEFYNINLFNDWNNFLLSSTFANETEAYIINSNWEDFNPVKIKVFEYDHYRCLLLKPFGEDKRCFKNLGQIINPHPGYRPFENYEECWYEMLRHEPFSWVIDGNITRKLITEVSKYNLITKEAKHNFNTAFTCFKFVDGTPFGKRIF